MIETNLTSAFVVGREAAKRMIPRGRGKIINIGSLTSELARATVAPYTVAKGGIKMLTRAMTAEWAAHNIQANAIGPGYMLTDMNQALIDNPSFDAWVKGRTPAGRWGKPDELIGTAVFLARPHPTTSAARSSMSTAAWFPFSNLRLSSRRQASEAKHSIRPVRRIAIPAAMLGAAGMAQAQDIKERSIKFAFANTADSAHGAGRQAVRRGGRAEERRQAEGQALSRRHAGRRAVVASAMQGGTIEMSMMGPGLLTGMDKEFGVFDTPFLFDNFKEVDAALDGPVGKKLLDKLPAKGLVGLSYWDHGFRILTNSKRPIAKLEDIQGLKIRVQQIPVFIESFNALGANAVPMPFPELYGALETKAVDGQENPFVSVEVTKFYEVQKYASTTRHAYSPLLVLASKKFWDQLSERRAQDPARRGQRGEALRAPGLARHGRQGGRDAEGQGHGRSPRCRRRSARACATSSSR